MGYGFFRDRRLEVRILPIALLPSPHLEESDISVRDAREYMVCIHSALVGLMRIVAELLCHKWCECIATVCYWRQGKAQVAPGLRNASRLLLYRGPAAEIQQQIGLSKSYMLFFLVEHVHTVENESRHTVSVGTSTVP